MIGRDLEIAATAACSSTTPKPVQRKAFLAAQPARRRSRRPLPAGRLPAAAQGAAAQGLTDGRVEYLHDRARTCRTKGLNKANELRLRAFNVTSGPEKGSCRILAYVGGQLVADVTDPAAGELQGRASGFSVGAIGNAKGAVGSFDDVVVRVPSPF